LRDLGDAADASNRLRGGWLLGNMALWVLVGRRRRPTKVRLLLMIELGIGIKARLELLLLLLLGEVAVNLLSKACVSNREPTRVRRRYPVVELRAD
jgi:hypothetical protein